MSRQESESHYQPIGGGHLGQAVEISPGKGGPRSLLWVLFACTATVCFALSAYILGIISVSGSSAKFLSSFGYLTISLLIMFVKNVKF